MTTTAETITDDQIRKLRAEALAASDHTQVDLCNRALVDDDHTTNQDGHPIPFADWSQEEARWECARAIAAAEAQAEEVR